MVLPDSELTRNVILAPENTTGEHESLRQSLEDLLKLMLIVWCKENEAIKLVSSISNGKNAFRLLANINKNNFTILQLILEQIERYNSLVFKVLAYPAVD